MFTKGAPEVILAKSTRERRDGQAVALTDQRREEILQTNRGNGLTGLASFGLGLPTNRRV